MKKYNLPVIILNGIVLLPHNTLKLEFDSKNLNNNVIDMSLLFHDNYILVVCEYKENTKVGILSKLENILQLPNGNTRVDLKGIRRLNIVEFLNFKSNEPLESIVSEIEKEKVENEQIIINKLKKELKSYVNNIPYISNGVLSLIEKETSLDKFTDLVVPNIISDKKRLLEYLNNLSSIGRGEMLLKDIYNENEMFQIERRLDMKVKKEMDESQKEFFLREKMKMLKEKLGDS